MAFASALNTPNGLRRLPSSRHEITRTGPAALVLPRHLPARFPSTLALARRKNHRGSALTSSPPKIKKKSAARNAEEEDEVDGDAIDALFSLLEEDLRNDGVSLDDDGEDDEISEEDLARLEEELAEAFGAIDEDEDEDDDGDDDVIQSNATEEEEEEDEDDEVEVAVKLKTWQFRRLASALKVGRRKTSIKNLAAELCLDRALVLQMLRDPPPNLLMLSAALPDAPAPKKSVPVPEPEPEETIVEATVDTVVETDSDAAVVEAAVKVPVHVRQQKFSAQKRLKKVHLDTLERVYRRTKRPTNAIVSSIVHVTNLPRKRIVKWFEDKRSEEGVPDSRRPYQPSAPTTVN
ncbi:PREDICTED: retrotransposon-like protein 1 [Fragaria vesca subsp. vesca]|uniref:retrotransposon-like protein 1 n=1 Tax=Fragaria vesca subsp. vesca TaxID=101020 RepID=UPI0002C33723|nr:PREDICTED: retrotransposon-like protein 1 [Fragaria vesca subsp. vesca]